MKLHSDFGSLWVEVRKITSEPADFRMDTAIRAFEEIDSTLSDEGVEVELKELGSTGGLLSYRGRQVLLYIPDQGSKIGDVLQRPGNGTKFHVSHCAALERMRREGRFERYIATNDLSGDFRVHGRDWRTRDEVEGRARLNVCQNCLEKLNYRQFRTFSPGPDRYRVVRQFSIAEFFETYSSIFPHMPKQFGASGAVRGYTQDWTDVSAQVRAGRSYRCEDCQVDLNEHKRLLHVHHVNGVRSDNTPENLRVLCAACHKRQARHDHLHLVKADMQLIQRLRRTQSIRAATWGDVFDLADTAVHGVLGILRRAGVPRPEIGFALKERGGRVVEVEAAWPSRRQAIVLSEADRPDVEGWQFFTLEQLTEHPELLSESTCMEPEPSSPNGPRTDPRQPAHGPQSSGAFISNFGSIFGRQPGQPNDP